MKKALFFALVLSFLFIIVSRACSGCKKHKPAANNDSVSESAGSDIESGTPDDSVVDDSVVDDSVVDNSVVDNSVVDNSVVDDSKDSSLNEDAESNEELNEDVSDRVTIVDSNPNYAVVIVEGAGETLAEAKKDALRCAVEEVVGSLVDAQSRVENDELIEQILTASSAYVEKYSVLSRKIENGLATVKIRATVVKESLTKKLKQSKGGQTVAIDGASLAGKAATKAESEKQGALFLANFLKKEDFPYSLFDIEFDGQPEIAKKGKNTEYTVDVMVTVNRERYLEFTKRLKPILEKYSKSHSSFILKTYSSDNKISYSTDNVPEFANNNLPFCVCTSISGDYQSLKFDTYELPRKFWVPLTYYRSITPVASVSLLDESNEEISSNSFRLLSPGSTSDSSIFNLMSQLVWNLHFYYNNSSNDESTTVPNLDVSKFIDKKFEFENDLRCITPFANRWAVGHTYGMHYKIYYTVTLTLTPDELERVKSASVSVISNNPDMDKAFERMADEIDQVPTN